MNQQITISQQLRSELCNICVRKIKYIYRKTKLKIKNLEPFIGSVCLCVCLYGSFEEISVT